MYIFACVVVLIGTSRYKVYSWHSITWICIVYTYIYLHMYISGIYIHVYIYTYIIYIYMSLGIYICYVYRYVHQTSYFWNHHAECHCYQRKTVRPHSAVLPRSVRPARCGAPSNCLNWLYSPWLLFCRGDFFPTKKGYGFLILGQVSAWFAEDFWNLTKEYDFGVICLDNFPFDHGQGCWSIPSESSKIEIWPGSSSWPKKRLRFCWKIFTFGGRRYTTWPCSQSSVRNLVAWHGSETYLQGLAYRIGGPYDVHIYIYECYSMYVIQNPFVSYFCVVFSNL